MSIATDEFKDFKSLTCPQCRKNTPIESWEDNYVGCDLCGEHDAIQCPNCLFCFDNTRGIDDVHRATTGVSKYKTREILIDSFSGGFKYE